MLFFAFALVVLAGCGSDSGTASRLLSGAEAATVSRSQVSLYSYCRDLARYLAGKRTEPSESETQQVNDDLERLIALARKKPDARSQSGETPRLALGDMAEDLEGSNCSGDFERELDQALGELPPEQ